MSSNDDVVVRLRLDQVHVSAGLADAALDLGEGHLRALAAGHGRHETAAAAEIHSALERLVAEHALARLQVLEDKAREEPLDAAEKAELQGLLRTKGQSGRSAGPK